MRNDTSKIVLKFLQPVKKWLYFKVHTLHIRTKFLEAVSNGFKIQIILKRQEILSRISHFMKISTLGPKRHRHFRLFDDIQIPVMAQHLYGSVMLDTEKAA
jgi:hypothetical protein